jgi:hypothetical protein
MRRMHKKAALELSINAIVIVILAMTLLGLGLGFVRNMFRDIGDTTTQVQDQMKEQILDDLRRGDKKLSFPSQRLDIEGGEEEVIAVGVKNTDAAGLDFKICMSEIVGETEIPISSIQSLTTSNTAPYAFFWDTTTQILSAGEANVYGITIKADNSATGTRLFKIKILDKDDSITNTTAANPRCGDSAVSAVPEIGTEYTSKTFFIKFY